MTAEDFQTCGFLDSSEQGLTRCLFGEEGRTDCCFALFQNGKIKLKKSKKEHSSDEILDDTFLSPAN